MKLETAEKILKDRAENFYGRTISWLIDDMNKCFEEVGYYNENEKVVQAYKIFKKEYCYDENTSSW